MSIRQIASAIGTGHLLAPLVQIVSAYAETPRDERFRNLIIDLIARDEAIEVSDTKNISCLVTFGITTDHIFRITFRCKTLIWHTKTIHYPDINAIYQDVIDKSIVRMVHLWLCWNNERLPFEDRIYIRPIEEILLSRIDGVDHDAKSTS